MPWNYPKGGGGSGGGGGTVVQTVRTAGDVVIPTNQQTYTALDTGLDITLTALAGDQIEIGASLLSSGGTTTFNTKFDVQTLVAGSPVNYCSGAGAGGGGINAWFMWGSESTAKGGSFYYTVVSGDIGASSRVVLRLVCKVDFAPAATRTVFANANDPLMFWARNNNR